MLKIGLPFWKIGDNSFGATLNYITFAERYGEIVPLMPDSEIRKDLDLLIIPGGADVDTSRYNQRPDYYTQKPDIYKEHFDRNHLPKYIELGTPIFGVCRGLQTVAVELGAELIQNMWHETNNMQDPKDSGYALVHKIKVKDLGKIGETPVNEYLQGQLLGVNSRHHQVVDPDTLEDTLLSVIAWHEKKEYHIEALAHLTLPIVLVQFHPEDINDMDTVMWVDSMIEKIMITKKSILS